jgi:hypothetical protein
MPVAGTKRLGDNLAAVLAAQLPGAEAELRDDGSLSADGFVLGCGSQHWRLTFAGWRD